MNATFRQTCIFLLFGALALAVGACNTMRGVGKDTEQAGKKIQQEADEHQHQDKKDDHHRPDSTQPSQASP